MEEPVEHLLYLLLRDLLIPMHTEALVEPTRQITDMEAPLATDMEAMEQEHMGPITTPQIIMAQEHKEL
jgi:hypothetical protein